MFDTSVGQNGKLRCTLCPHGCTIVEGKYGICGVRRCENGKLSLPYYGLLSGTGLDPIEKKPLYHYYPGRQILSVGFFGCNFSCPFCQNYSISQRVVDDGTRTQPEELVDLAIRNKSFGIAYTYSEPLIHFEYVLATAKLAREKGLRNVLVTNGYINTAPAEKLLEYIDAANVDLKSFQNEFYSREIKGSLSPVLDFIALASKSIAIEATTLVIPGKNDSDEEIIKIADFLAELNPDIPLHLSCYYPTYKYDIEATSSRVVHHLVEVAGERLNYVYAGNVYSSETNTFCPSCGSLLIQRRGYVVSVRGLADGVCDNCGENIPIAGV